MTRLRWGDEAPPDADAARARLVDAAEACFRRYGAAKTTMEDVARTARVARATVYRYFRDRDALVLEVVLRDARRFLDSLAATIERQSSFEQAIVEGVLATVAAARTDDSLALLFAPDVIGLTTSIDGAAEALFSVTAEFMRPLLHNAQRRGLMRSDVRLDDAAEWILRMVISLLTVEGPRRRTPAQQRRFLSVFLVAALLPAPSASDSPPSGHTRSAASRSRPRRRTAAARVSRR